MSFERGYSSLLTEAEHETLFWLVGTQCTVLATTVAQMYTGKYNHDKKWTKQHAGVLVIARDSRRNAHYMQMYCLAKKRKLWEHEINNDLNYTVVIPPTHIFESEDVKVAFNFRNDYEANEFYKCFLETISNKDLSTSPKSIENEELRQDQAIIVNSEHQKDIKCFPNTKHTLRKNGKHKIGPPTHFEHKIHISVNEKEGLNIEGDLQKIKQFIIDAGVNNVDFSSSDLKQAIYKFFEENQAIKDILKKHTQYLSKQKKATQTNRMYRDTYLNESTKRNHLINAMPILPPKQNQSSKHSSFDFDNEDSDYDNFKSWDTLYNKKKDNQEYNSSKFDPLDYDIPNENPKSVTPIDEKQLDHVLSQTDSSANHVSSKPTVPSKENALRKLSMRRTFSQEQKEESNNYDAAYIDDIINNIANQLQNNSSTSNSAKVNRTNCAEDQDYDYL